MYIVVDVGGTNTRVAASEDGKTLTVKKHFSTPKIFEDGVSKIVASVNKLVGDRTLNGLAIGIPGTIDHRTGKQIRNPNLPSWNERDVVQTFKEPFDVPIIFVNDAELAAMGEAVFGSGKEYRIVGFLTVSTGIGGALVVEKRLVPRAFNTEPGHMMVEFEGKPSPRSGQRGTLEMYASGNAFKEQFGMKPEDCDDPGTWSAHLQRLGQGLINIIVLWSPEILVIGGGLSQKGKLFFQPLRKFVNENLKMFPPPPIVPAELGDDAGLYGGLALIRNNS